MKRTKKPPLSEQVKKHANKPVRKKPPKGNIETMTSTGSTLLDLAISGGRVHGGGIPGGILVEIFGPNQSGKTVLLCEIAGAIQRGNGEVLFHDPEARLNTQFASIFDLNTKKNFGYDVPDTVPEIFKNVRKWSPDLGHVNGIFADSLAALSTEMELDNEEGDKMGMRRGKEFSQELRKTCRTITKNNYLMVCSNQIRETTNTYGPKYKSPGGLAIGFYSSLRLRTDILSKIKPKKTYKGKDVTEATGITINVEVFKSSVWKPLRTAPVSIDWEYGIDDIRENLKYVKRFSNYNVYSVGTRKLSKSLEDSIRIVERDNLEDELREEVIDLWEEIEKLYAPNRKKKKR